MLSPKIFGCLVFNLISLLGHSSHIVGGEIQYKHLGGNRYQLIFKIYRDCSSTTRFDGDYPSNPDNKFYFGIFQGNETVNVFSENFRSISLKSKRTLSSAIVHSCLQPNNSCVEEGIYETIVELPRNDMGYTIIHQRCCRNDAILNIQPLDGGDNTMPGFTIRCYIPPINIFANNSPVFRNFPPIFICRDQPYYFDHGADDIDGDSLRYFLSSPLDGLSQDEPLSANQSISDLKKVNWELPYSIDNVLGGSPALAIDSYTGFLSCRPNRNGRFVVSVLVVEYRNGIAIDTINRDFQFNVVNCDIPKADMPFLPGTMNPSTGVAAYLYTFCDTFFVKFKNTSSNSTHYKWEFGEPTKGPLNISRDFEPVHTYSDTGVFTVKLYAYKVRLSGDTCVDSTTRYVRVYPRFKVLFSGHNACPDSPVYFKDLTTSHYGITTKWEWSFGDGNKSALRHPIHTYSNSGMYKVKLVATDNKFCIDDTSFQLTIHQRPKFEVSIKKFCLGEETTIRAGVNISSPDSLILYKWSFQDEERIGPVLSYRIVNETPVPVQLYVMTDKGCPFKKDYLIMAYPKPVPPLLLDSYFVKCSETLFCGIGDPYAVRYKWHDGITDSVRYLTKPGWYKVTITYPCEVHIDSFYLYHNYLKSNFHFDDKCVGDTYVFINTSETRLTSRLRYKWQIGSMVDTSLNFKFQFKDAMPLKVKLIVFDTYGCSDSIIKTPNVFPLPQFDFPFDKVCLGVATLLKPRVYLAAPYFPATYFWKLNGVEIGSDSVYLYTAKNYERQKFSLAVRTDKGCMDSTIKWIRAHTKPKPIKLVDSFFIRCADSVLFDISDSLALSYRWRDGNTNGYRFINYPGKFYFAIEYPCETFKDSFRLHNSCTIEVPRAFTPNGDGNNDRLYIRGYAIKELLSFKIYNRQGQLLYFSKNLDEGWDGYYKGEAQNSESYFYTYEAITHANGTRASGEGQLLLLR
jgi:gliding motility-associated-like protein